MRPSAAAVRMPGRVESAVLRREAELGRPDDVAAPQAGSTLAPGHGVEHRLQRGGGRSRRLGEVGPPGDDDHRSGGELVGDLVLGQGGLQAVERAGLDTDAAPGMARQAGVRRADLDDLHLALLGGVAQAEEQDRQLLLEVRPEQDDGRRLRRLGDRRPRQTEHGGGQAVAELGVTVRRADGVGERGPREGVLVRPPRPTEDGDALRATGGERLAHELGGGVDRHVPRRLGEPALAAHERRGQALIGVGGLVVEAATVAQPAPVDGLGVDAELAHELVARRLHDDAAADAAVRARALDLLEVPRPGLEAVRRGGERADRADLHRVAGEVRRERLVGERQDLRLVATLGEADQRIAGDLVGEARAAVAQDAALAVEQHEVADRDRLLEVPLLLDVAALAGTVAERLVLQRALAALVADRAVERVVGEEQLEDALLGPPRQRRLGVDLHVRGDGDHARRRQLRTAPAVDLARGIGGTCRPSSSGCANRSAGCTCRPARRRR